MRDPAYVMLSELVAWCAARGTELEAPDLAGAHVALDRDVEGTLGLGEVLDAVATNALLPGGRLIIANRADQVRLSEAGPGVAERIAATLARARVSALLSDVGADLSDVFGSALAQEHIAVLTTQDPEELARAIEAWLAERRGPIETVHGSLADLFDIGLLVVGASGVGKSEAVLELVLRGHRLVADDLVEIHAAGGRLIGSAPELSRQHLEVRGVGILNLGDLLGPAAVQVRSEIGLVVELVPWDDATGVDRLGIDERTHGILGVRVPALQVPVTPGRNLGAILEIAVRNQLLKNQGRHSGIVFEQRVLDAIARRDGA